MHIGENGRLDVVTLFTMARSTSDHLGAGLLTLIDVSHDPVKLHLRDLGTLERLRVERVADLVFLRALLEERQELVIDGFVHQDTRAGGTALAVVEVDTQVDVLDGVVQIGVGKDDVGRLAAQLEGDFLEVALRCDLEDLAAHQRRAGKGHLVDIHVGRDRSARHAPESREDVDDTGGEAGLLDQFGHVQSGKRRLLGRFEDNGVAGGNGRSDLPRPHEQREVPWDDLATDAHRLMTGVRQTARVGIDRLADDLVRPATVVPDAVCREGNVALGDLEGLAVVERLDGGDGIQVALEEVRKASEETAALRGDDVPPNTFERFAGGFDGDVNVFLGGLVNGHDGFFVMRVDGFEGLAFYTGDEFIVDEPLQC